jgi:hypothetical protein
MLRAALVDSPPRSADRAQVAEVDYLDPEPWVERSERLEAAASSVCRVRPTRIARRVRAAVTAPARAATAPGCHRVMAILIRHDTVWRIRWPWSNSASFRS